MPAGPRQSMMLANGTQPHISQEDVQRHMMAQYAYQQQFIQSQNQQAQQIAQANGQTRADASNGGIRQFHPMASQLAMQHRPDSSGSPSTDSGQPIKRQADQSPIEGPNKKPRLFGKRPSESFHDDHTSADVSQHRRNTNAKLSRWPHGLHSRCLRRLACHRCLGRCISPEHLLRSV